uniref:Uncharacterized protein n=1 Tax=Triticum urartu TaxID=4572 RepID=A0A8R7V4L3_TRIUA
MHVWQPTVWSTEEIRKQVPTRDEISSAGSLTHGDYHRNPLALGAPCTCAPERLLDGEVLGEGR